MSEYIGKKPSLAREIGKGIVTPDGSNGRIANIAAKVAGGALTGFGIDAFVAPHPEIIGNPRPFGIMLSLMGAVTTALATHDSIEFNRKEYSLPHIQEVDSAYPEYDAPQIDTVKDFLREARRLAPPRRRKSGHAEVGIEEFNKTVEIGTHISPGPFEDVYVSIRSNEPRTYSGDLNALQYHWVKEVYVRVFQGKARVRILNFAIQPGRTPTEAKLAYYDRINDPKRSSEERNVERLMGEGSEREFRDILTLLKAA